MNPIAEGQVAFDEQQSWSDAIYHLRVLSMARVSCYVKIRMKDGRLDRRTLKALNDLARPIIERLSGLTQKETVSA